MKKQFLFLFLALGIFSIGISSCSKEESLAEPNTEVDAIQAKNDQLYTACWDEWGRASRDCKGMGLCNFEDCWGWQDPCCDNPAPIEPSEIDPDSYVIVIALDILNPEEKSAILNQSPLYVDEDLVDEALNAAWSTLTIKANAYPFDPKVGTDGGYIVPLVID